MKNYRYYIAVLACAVLALSGCNKEPGFTTGKAIKFGATTMAEPLTKTAYGNIKTETVSGEEKRTHQMIDWVEGDIIRITCAQASTTESGTSTSADYKTSAETKTGTESRANLSLASNNDKGLRWGSTEVAHTFYGVYPSPYVKSGDSLTDGGSLTGSIPQSQPVTVSGSGPYEASVDMTNQYLVAKRTVAAGKQSFEDGEVFLYFTPITTAIEFEVTNAMTEDLAISSIELISTNYNLSGTFTTSLTGLTETGASYSNYPTVTAATGAKKNASVSFGTTGLTLGANEKLTFTIFLLPESNLNDLTFRINKKGTNEYIQTKLARSETEYLTFTRCKKHFVKGLLADEGVKWMLDFAADVVSWTEGYSEDSEIYDQNNYTFEVNGSSDWSSLLYNNTNSTLSQTLTVKSYTSPKEDGTKVTAVPFDASYSVDGGLTWSSFDAATSGSAKNGLYGLAGTGNAGSTTGLDYTLTAASRTASQPGSHEYWVGEHGDWSPEDWTDPDDIISLNQYNFITDDPNVFKENTANCYIIRHAGKYCIPMVYGNGQMNGSKNRKAYWFGNQASDALENCLNYKGDPIINPIIAEDLGIVTDYGTDGSKETLSSQVNRTLGEFSAVVLWSDASAVIKNVEIIAAPGFSWNGYYHATHGIYFEVDPNTVCQCNAVIALKDASTGLIIWSWHIWITNNPAVGNPVYETVMDNGRIVDYFPMPAIGYKDGTVYFGRPKTLLKLRQQRSGKEILFTVNQTDVSEGSSVMYYQHGRKDPFSATATFGTMPSGDAVVNASKAPSTPFASWNDGGYSNLWSGAYSTLGSLVYVQDAMRKTIYDPSPRGFIVPVQTAFAPFTSDTRILGGFANGYTFKLSDEDKEGAFFGAYGYKTSGSAVTGSGTKGMFWTSVPESSSNGGAFEFNSSSVSLPVDIPLSAACPVRPVTDPNFAQ